MAAKEQNNAELFDLWKKAAVMKQIKTASCAKDRKKNCWRRNYKQLRENFQYQKCFMLGLTTFLTFKSSRSYLTCFDVII